MVGGEGKGEGGMDESPMSHAHFRKKEKKKKRKKKKFQLCFPIFPILYVDFFSPPPPTVTGRHGKKGGREE